MLSFIRCSLACCHQKDGYCSVNITTCVVSSGDVGCIYFEPMQTGRPDKEKETDIMSNIIDKD